MVDKTYSQSDLDTRVSKAVAGARLAEAKFIAAGIEAKGLDFAEWLQERITQLEAASEDC
jgi:hypothetical protein